MKEEEELDIFIKSSRFFQNTQEFEKNLRDFRFCSLKTN